MISSWSRTLLVLAAFAAAVAVVRPAMSDAPYCDLDGATGVSPPPFTMIPDRRWEPSAVYFFARKCFVTHVFAQFEQAPHPSKDRAADNPLSYPDLACLATLDTVDVLEKVCDGSEFDGRFSNANGVRRRVYRPPRLTWCR